MRLPQAGLRIGALATRVCHLLFHLYPDGSKHGTNCLSILNGSQISDLLMLFSELRDLGKSGCRYCPPPPYLCFQPRLLLQLMLRHSLVRDPCRCDCDVEAATMQIIARLWGGGGALQTCRCRSNTYTPNSMYLKRDNDFERPWCWASRTKPELYTELSSAFVRETRLWLTAL